MFSNLNVKAKLLLSFAVVILFTIGLTVLSISVQVYNKNVIQNVENILGTRHERVKNVYTSMMDLDDIGFLFSGDPSKYTPELES